MGMTREECQRFADRVATDRRTERYAEDGKDTLVDTMRISEEARIDSLLALAQEAERRGRAEERAAVVAFVCEEQRKFAQESDRALMIDAKKRTGIVASALRTLAAYLERGDHLATTPEPAAPHAECLRSGQPCRTPVCPAYLTTPEPTR